MKNRNLFLQVGFTMIELLVVIAVIGILSVAVLSTINPIEQINKGRDTRAQADAAQLLQGIDRFFALREGYPWSFVTTTWVQASAADYQDANGNPDYLASFALDDSGGDRARNFDPGVGAESTWSWADVLVEAGEVKEGFIDRISRATDTVDYMIFKPNLANATTYVCFPPASLSFAQEAKERCTEETDFGIFGASNDSTLRDLACGAANDCTADTSDTSCLVCVP